MPDPVNMSLDEIIQAARDNARNNSRGRGRGRGRARGWRGGSRGRIARSRGSFRASLKRLDHNRPRPVNGGGGRYNDYESPARGGRGSFRRGGRRRFGVPVYGRGNRGRRGGGRRGGGGRGNYSYNNSNSSLAYSSPNGANTNSQQQRRGGYRGRGGFRRGGRRGGASWDSSGVLPTMTFTRSNNSSASLGDLRDRLESNSSRNNSFRGARGRGRGRGTRGVGLRRRPALGLAASSVRRAKELLLRREMRLAAAAMRRLRNSGSSRFDSGTGFGDEEEEESLVRMVGSRRMMAAESDGNVLVSVRGHPTTRPSTTYSFPSTSSSTLASRSSQPDLTVSLRNNQYRPQSLSIVAPSSGNRRASAASSQRPQVPPRHEQDLDPVIQKHIETIKASRAERAGGEGSCRVSADLVREVAACSKKKLCERFH